MSQVCKGSRGSTLTAAGSARRRSSSSAGSAFPTGRTRASRAWTRTPRTWSRRHGRCSAALSRRRSRRRAVPRRGSGRSQPRRSTSAWKESLPLGANSTKFGEVVRRRRAAVVRDLLQLLLRGRGGRLAELHEGPRLRLLPLRRQRRPQRPQRAPCCRHPGRRGPRRLRLGLRRHLRPHRPVRGVDERDVLQCDRGQHLQRRPR